jgi:WD40 repeat protein
MQAKLNGAAKWLVPSQTGRYLAYQLQGSVGVKDVFLKKDVWPEQACACIKEHTRMMVAWNGDDLPYAIVLTDGSSATVLFPDDCKSERTLPGEYYRACCSTDGRTLFLGGLNGRVLMVTPLSVAVHPIACMSQFGDYEHKSTVTCMDVLPSLEGRDTLLVTGCLDGAVCVWDAAKGVVIRRLATDGRVDSVRIGPNTGRIMACTEQSVVTAWEPDSDTPAHIRKFEHPPWRVFMLPDVFEIVAQTQQSEFARIIMGCYYSNKFQLQVSPVAVAFDGRCIWTATAAGGVDKTPISPWRPDPDSHWYTKPDPSTQTRLVVTVRQPADSPLADMMPDLLEKSARDTVAAFNADPSTLMLEFAKKYGQREAGSSSDPKRNKTGDE